MASSLRGLAKHIARFHSGFAIFGCVASPAARIREARLAIAFRLRGFSVAQIRETRSVILSRLPALNCVRSSAARFRLCDFGCLLSVVRFRLCVFVCRNLRNVFCDFFSTARIFGRLAFPLRGLAKRIARFRLGFAVFGCVAFPCTVLRNTFRIF